MASSRNGSKSGGLRYLWIPGRKRSHPKGRFDSTSKRINYHSRQKRSEPWSLGGSKGQKDLLKAESDLLDSPSISGLAPLTCAAGMPTVAAITNMPALADNKFAILEQTSNKDQLPSPPKDGDHNGTINNHISASDLIGDTVANHNLKKIDEDLEDDLPSPPSSEGASEYSPHKKHLSTNYRKQNSNNRPEIDLNSIESVSECKLKYSEMDRIDGIYNMSLNDTCTTKNKKKKKKRNKHKDSPNSGTSDEEDDKVVKCLYYTLMCCECTIS